MLVEFPGIFSKPKTNFRSCFLLPSEFVVLLGTFPVTFRPYHINPILAKQVGALLDEYLATGLIQHSASPYEIPLVVIPKRGGGVRIMVKYKNLNNLSILDQLFILRVGDVLDYLNKGKLFPPLDLGLSFHQIVAHKNGITVTAVQQPSYMNSLLCLKEVMFRQDYLSKSSTKG